MNAWVSEQPEEKTFHSHQGALLTFLSGVSFQFWQHPGMMHGLRRTLMTWSGCLALSAAAEIHTFTNSDGKSFQGKIVRTANNAVTIRRETDGREFTLPLSKLSPDDQAHANAWAAENPVLKLSFQSIVKTENREGNGKGSSKSQAYCEIEIKNNHSESTPPSNSTTVWPNLCPNSTIRRSGQARKPTMGSSKFHR